jgi:hypothetical protein
MLSGFLKMLIASMITLSAALETADDLHNQYYTIFPSGNRNAASHRWATYVLERSGEMTDPTFRNVMSGFCAVSGSPVYASSAKRWKMTLPLVGTGEEVTGMMYFCCAPCVCDTQELIKLDTKTITTADGPKKYYFTVIGNPCLGADALEEKWQDPFSGQEVTLQQTAPDVKCSGTDLEKATISDNGYIIIGMFFESDTPNHATSDLGFNDSGDAKGYCEERAKNGYQSGMGEIFRKVALITPMSDSYASSNEVTQSSSVMWSETTTVLPSSTTGTASGPAPEPEPQPEPAPEPAPEPTPEPSPSPAPEPEPSPSPAPASDSTTTVSTTKNTNTIFLDTTKAEEDTGMTSHGMKFGGCPMMIISFLVGGLFA